MHHEVRPHVHEPSRPRRRGARSAGRRSTGRSTAGSGERRRSPTPGPSCRRSRRRRPSRPATAARSWSTGRSTRPRRSSAASRSSTCPTSTPRSSWPRPGRRWSSPASRSRSGRWSDHSAVRVTPPAAGRRTARGHRARRVRPAGGPPPRIPRPRRRRGGGGRGRRRGAQGLAPRRDPGRPGGWLLTAARHNALDLLRGGPARTARHCSPEVAAPTARSATDERLALIFGCCHPALAPGPAGPDAAGRGRPDHAEIARASLALEPTIAQRIVRAKRKIVQAGIPVRVPGAEELPERLDTVLTVVYLAYNEAYLASTGGTQDRDLADDAIWLAGVVHLPARRARGARPARAAAAAPRAGRRAVRRREPPGAAGRPGPDAVGPGRDRGRRGMLERAATMRRPGRSSSRRRSRPAMPRHRPGPRPTGCRSSRSTTCCCATTRRRWSGSTTRSRLAEVRGAGAARWPRSTSSPTGSRLPPLPRHPRAAATRARPRRRGRAANARALALTSNVAERHLLATRLHRRPLTTVRRVLSLATHLDAREGPDRVRWGHKSEGSPGRPGIPSPVTRTDDHHPDGPPSSNTLNPASSSTGTPRLSALSAFEPGLSPTTT